MKFSDKRAPLLPADPEFEDVPGGSARIFNAAEKALSVIRELPENERLAAIAFMQALQISTEVKSGAQLEQAMAYVSTTVHTLLPEIRQAAKALRGKRSN